MFNRIAVAGAGDMGTLLCVCLAKAGKPIDAIDVNREHVDVLKRM